MTTKTNNLPSKDPSLYSSSCETQALDYMESLKSKMEALMLDIEITKRSASILKREIHNLEK